VAESRSVRTGAPEVDRFRDFLGRRRRRVNWRKAVFAVNDAMVFEAIGRAGCYAPDLTTSRAPS